MADRDPDCLFCKIVANEIPADRVLENDDVVAFRDIAPQAPTHVLVIPRRHVPDVDTLADEDGSLLSAMFAAVRRVTPAAAAASVTRQCSDCTRCTISARICRVVFALR